MWFSNKHEAVQEKRLKSGCHVVFKCQCPNALLKWKASIQSARQKVIKINVGLLMQLTGIIISSQKLKLTVSSSISTWKPARPTITVALVPNEAFHRFAFPKLLWQYYFTGCAALAVLLYWQWYTTGSAAAEIFVACKGQTCSSHHPIVF